MGVFGSMLHRRAIAAKRYPAFLAGAQVQPYSIIFDTFLAYIVLRLLQCFNSEEVFADMVFHCVLILIAMGYQPIAIVIQIYYTSAKYLCTKLMAIDPSPTADATR